MKSEKVLFKKAFFSKKFQTCFSARHSFSLRSDIQSMFLMVLTEMERVSAISCCFSPLTREATSTSLLRFGNWFMQSIKAIRNSSVSKEVSS